MNFFQRFNNRFPYRDDYVCLDIETSGLSPVNNHICTIGHAVVRDRRLIHAEWYALDWTRHPRVEQALFATQLERTERAMQERGKSFVHTYEWLAEFGAEPEEVLARYLEVVETAEREQMMLVAHNGWRFDVPFMCNSWHNWLQVDWEFAADGLYDSGVAEKASQLPEHDSPVPRDYESMQEWARRVGNMPRRGIFWALDSHCATKYALLEGAAFSSADLHVVAPDAALLHYLYEAHREQAHGTST